MTLDPLTFILEIINFLVLLWLLSHFLYKPLKLAINRRQQALQEAQLATQREQQQATNLAKQYQQKLDEWQLEQAQRQQQLQTEIASMRDKALADVQASARTEHQRQQSLRAMDATNLEHQQQQRAIDSALQLCQRFLQRLSGPELDQALLHMLLEDLQHMPPEARSELQRALEENHHRIDILSAQPLPETSQRKLENSLQSLFIRPPTCHFQVDAGLVGGFRLVIGARVLHANLHDELAFFQQSLNHHQQEPVHLGRTHD